MTLGRSSAFKRAALRVLEVNTLEPLLKQLTPLQTLVEQGSPAVSVSVCGIHGESLRVSWVVGFGRLSEEKQDT